MELQTSTYGLESNQEPYECEARRLSSQGRYLDRKTRTQKKCQHTSFHRVRFQPTITTLEREPEFYAVQCTFTAIGRIFSPSVYIRKASSELGFQTLFPDGLSV
jgi:hypothetical protein